MFREWGIPTAQCLQEARKATNLELIATGGIRTGIDIAKALCMGASLGGMAFPFFKKAAESQEVLEHYVKNLIYHLKIAMFCTGSKTIRDLTSDKLQTIDS